jgi:hypothetical protein
MVSLNGMKTANRKLRSKMLSFIFIFQLFLPRNAAAIKSVKNAKKKKRKTRIAINLNQNALSIHFKIISTIYFKY